MVSSPAHLPPVVAARFYAHEWVLSNRTSRKLYAESPPRLDCLQQNLVTELTTHGIAVVPFERLFAGMALWTELATDAASFTAEVEARNQHAGAGATAGRSKKHLWRRHPFGVQLAYDDRWLRLGASCRILDIVNAYLSLCAKLIYVDQWFTPADADAARARVSSQQWHRDYTDRHLVKVFIYLTDVDEECGPFEYVSQSATGQYSRYWAWRPLGRMYPPAEEFTRAVPRSAVRTITGGAGTVIFSDTSGFHRGGYATAKSRAMAVFNYASPASLHSLTTRNFRVVQASLPHDLPAAARFALI